MAKLIDLTGRRFGRLEVLARATNRYTPNGTFKTMWKCRCECGKEAIVDASNLRRKDRATLSCGCLWKDSVTSKDYMGVEFRRYQVHNLRGRKRNKVEFSLSQEEFAKLILEDCHYCGSKPKQKTHVGGRVRNGIDRVDNSQGYKIENVVTACFKCNHLKGALSKKEFLDRVNAISAHNLRSQ